MTFTKLLLLGSLVAASVGSQDASAQQYERVSVKSNGGELQHGAGQGIAISTDGQFVAFTAIDDDVTGSGSPVYSVFLRDRVAGTTSRISVSRMGGPPNASSYSPSISRDGRLIAFMSDATDFGPADTNNDVDVYLRDHWVGYTVLVSAGSWGAKRPKMSSDGTHVGFDDDFSVLDYDVASGSISTVITAGGSPIEFTAISADGQKLVGAAKGPFIAKESYPGGTYGTDLQDVNGLDFVNPSDPLLTADGRYVFVAAYLVDVYGWYYGRWPWYPITSGGISGWWNAYQFHSYVLDMSTRQATIVKDRHGNEIIPTSVSANGSRFIFLGSAPPFTQTGLCICARTTGTTKLLVADPAVADNAISENGRKVAFLSSLSTLVPGDTNNSWDVFVTDGL